MLCLEPERRRALPAEATPDALWKVPAPRQTAALAERPRSYKYRPRNLPEFAVPGAFWNPIKSSPWFPYKLLARGAKKADVG